MLEISYNLQNFYKTVNDSTESMSSSVKDLSEKLTLVKNATTTAKNKIEQCYNSNNKSALMRRLDTTGNVLSDITTSISGDLSGIVSKASTICTLVEGMETDKTDYDSVTSKLNTERDKKIKDYSVLIGLQNEQARLSRDFNDKNREANQLYNQLQEPIGTAFIDKYMNADYLNHLELLNYGTFVEAEPFVGTNEIKIYYWIYVPDYGGVDVEGKPLHIYMHGSGETGNGVLNCGLPKLIYEQKIVPEGPVICLQAKKGGEFSDPYYYQALVELVNQSVEKYNCNPDKVSVSGHSMGAIGGYKLVSKHPDVFSAFVPISGLTYNYDDVAASNVKIWQMHGDQDCRSTTYSNAVQVYNYLHDRLNINLHTFKGKGHGIQTMTFEGEYDDWGESINPLTWAMRQDRTSTEVIL